MSNEIKATPWLIFSAFNRHRSLTWEMTKRDVTGRYRGASLGMAWSMISPFLMLMVYTLAFGTIMKSRWPEADGSTSNFALIIFIGLIIHGFFSECFIRSANLVVTNPNFVKKIIFPLEIMPWPMIFSALFHAFMNVLVFVIFHWYVVGKVPITIFLLPLVFFPLAILTAGISWFVAAISVYFRDISQLTSPIATAMLFLSSAIVPLDSVPPSFKRIFELNPLTLIIDEARSVALWGRFPDWESLLLYTVVSCCIAVAGFLFFQASRKGFADVL